MEAQTPAEAVLAGSGEDAPPFTLELSQDQKDIRDWVRGFAAMPVLSTRRWSG